MGIHQLSVMYQAEQDRILVQTNTLAGEVLRVWLTRRLVINFHPRLAELATKAELVSGQLATADTYSQKMLMDFKKQATLATGDFKTPFDATAASFPVGETPLLVTSINLTPLPNGALRVAFEEKLGPPLAPRGFQVTLASTLLYGFIHLFDAAIRASNWGILEPLQSRPDEEEIENPGNARQKRYMN